jgi:phosphatidate cytidylyltransferase
MKQRIISAAFGLSILFFVFAFFDTVVLNIAVAIVIAMELTELVTAAGYPRNTPFFYVAMAFSAVIPFFETRLISRILPTVCFLFALVFFSLMLRHHAALRIEQLSFLFFFAILLAFSTNCFVYLRDMFGPIVGLYGVLVTLAGAWMSDTGAYFFGIALGRRRLAPTISPKKTVEGALGGAVVALASQMLVAWIYTRYCALTGASVSVNYWLLALLSPFISALSVLGDLSASVVKRQFGVKDFGRIMPGHGGALDRFDSVLLVIPFVYNLFLYFPIIRVL